tara:strand:+ start:5117 stop:7111 length:1995 start_codon:yes stop_codon:yes gene_type:complete
MLSSKHSHHRGNSTLVLLAIIVTSVGGMGYYCYSLIQSAIEPKVIYSFQFGEAEVGRFMHTIRETGDIEAAENEEIKCEVRSPGGVEIITVVDEGEIVKKGDLLIELDTSTLDEQKQAQNILVNRALSTKTSANAALRQAEITKQEYTLGTFLQNEALMEANILIAKQMLANNQDTAAFSERLAAKGFVTQQQLAADRFAVKRASLELSLSETELKTLREITREKMLVGFDADIETRKAALEAENKNYAEELKKLEEINDMISKCTILAPQDGTVVHANYGDERGQQFTVEPGATVRERQTIIYLPDLSQLQVKTPIAEGKIASVREGMPVKIRVGALEDREFTGTVTSINRYAERQHWSQKIKRFATFIEIVGDSEGARVGLSADIEITVNRQNDRLQIPVQCLHEDNNQKFVLVKVPYDINNPLHGEELGEKHGDEENAFSIEAKMIDYEASNDKMLVLNDDENIEDGEQIVQNPRDYPDFLRRLVSNLRARTAMKRFSPNGDEVGQLSSEDVVKMNETLGYEGIANLEAVDLNSNNFISVDELSAFITKTQDLLIPLEDTTEVAAAGKEAKKTPEDEDAAYEKQAEEQVTKTMDKYDKNSDGTIDAEELTAAGPVGDFLKRADKNKDGKVTKKEMVAGTVQMLKAAASGATGGRPGGGRGM